MLRTFVVGSLLLAGLAAWDARLAAGEESARVESARVRRLVPEERAADLRVSGLTVRTGGVEHLYASVGGVWRCISAHGAVALESAVLSTVQSLIAAEGVVQADDPARAALYGFSDEQGITVRLHGSKMLSAPDRDVLLELEVGLAIPGSGGCYVRPAGGDEIWAIDQDLRAHLAPRGTGTLPPLLDPSVTPAHWVEEAGGLRRIHVLHGDPFRESFELEKLDVERTEAELAMGQPEWEWILRRGTDEEVCEPLRVWAFERFFAHVPYRGILDPAEFRDEATAPRVRARVQVYSDGTEPIELRVYDRHRLGGYPVLNTYTGTVYLVAQETYDLLLPEGDALLELTGNNPWEPYLRR